MSNFRLCEKHLEEPSHARRVWPDRSIAVRNLMAYLFLLLGTPGFSFVMVFGPLD